MYLLVKNLERVKPERGAAQLGRSRVLIVPRQIITILPLPSQPVLKPSGQAACWIFSACVTARSPAQAQVQDQIASLEL